MNEFIILAIPFLGTSIGAAMVFFLKKQIAPKYNHNFGASFLSPNLSHPNCNLSFLQRY